MSSYNKSDLYSDAAFSKDEVLKYALENGIIDWSNVCCGIEMKQKEEYLKKHPYKIYQGKDGKWYTNLPDKEKGRVQRKRSTREGIEKVIVDYWRGQLENPTIEEVFNEWNDRRRDLEKIAPSTHLRNKQIFARHYGEIGKRKIKSLEPDEIEDFLDEQIYICKLTAKGYANLKGITKGFLKYAKKKKYITFAVTEIFDDMDLSEQKFKQTIKEDYEEVFDEAEWDKMIPYLIENLDIWSIGILLMFLTGIRVGEMVALKHTDFDGNTIRITRTETRFVNEEGKNVYAVKDFPKTKAGVRTVVIPKDYTWLAVKIKALNPFGEYIFERNGKRMTTSCFRFKLRRIEKKLGIYAKSPHKIRKTYGSILLDNNLDKRLITELMGHTDISVTENHYHRNRRTIDKKIGLVSGISEFKAM